MMLRKIYGLLFCAVAALTLAGCEDEDNILHGAASGTVYIDADTQGTMVRIDHVGDYLKGTIPSSSTLQGGERIYVLFTANYSKPVQTSRGKAYTTTFAAAEVIPDGPILPASATPPAYNDTIPLLYAPWVTYDPIYGDFITFRSVIRKGENTRYNYQLKFSEAYQGGKEAAFTLYFDESDIEDVPYAPIFQSFRIPSSIKDEIAAGTSLPIKLNIRYTAKQSSGFTIDKDSTLTVNYYPEKAVQE